MVRSWCRLDHAARPQVRDGFRTMAEAAQNLVCVLTELWRRPVFVRLRRLGEIDRLTDDPDVPEPWMPRALRNAEMLHLRLRKGLVDRVDRPARNARIVQQLHPMRARVGLGDTADPLAQR